jgi:hypothetical protein
MVRVIEIYRRTIGIPLWARGIVDGRMEAKSFCSAENSDLRPHVYITTVPWCRFPSNELMGSIDSRRMYIGGSHKLQFLSRGNALSVAE